MDDFGATIFMIVGVLAFLLLLPFLSFWLCYFGGWIAKILIGKHLVAGLACLGITIPLDQIPLLAATLGWIGGFFKTVSASRTKS